MPPAETPIPASQDEHATPVVTGPPSKRHRWVWWVLGIVAVTILLGMFAFSYQRLLTAFIPEAEFEEITTPVSDSKRPVLDEEGYPNGWYSTDGQSIYFGPSEAKVGEADVNTFRAIGGYVFARDKNHLYEFGNPYTGGIIADPDTFVQVGGAFYKDAKNVYLFSVDGGWVIREADVSTFEVLNDEYYAKDSTYVFFSTEIIQGASPNTFVVLSDRFGKDTSNVYCMENIVAGADTASFISSSTNVWVGHDKNHTYDCTKVVE